MFTKTFVFSIYTFIHTFIKPCYSLIMALKPEDIKLTLKKNGVYYAALRGKNPRWVSTGEINEKRAIRKALTMEARFKGMSRKMPTLKEFCLNEDGSTLFDKGGRYRKERAARGYILSENHYNRMSSHVKSHILPAFGHYKLDEISIFDVNQWILDLKKIKNHDEELSNESKNKIIIFFRQILDLAVTNGLIAINPLEKIKPFKSNKERKYPFTEQQYNLLFPKDPERLLYIWQAPIWLAYFTLLKDTGARSGEISALTWADWIYDDNVEGFYITKTADAGTGAIKLSPKTKAGVRAVPIYSQTAREAIRLWQAKTPYNKKNDLIFTFDGRRGFISNSINKHLRASALRAGCDISYTNQKGETAYRTAHCFRWTFNTTARKLLNDEELQKLIGHTSTNMTEHYDNPDKEELKARLTLAYNKINGGNNASD
jgi:integrase